MCFGICKHERMDGTYTLSPGERDCPCPGCGEHGDDALRAESHGPAQE